MKALRRFLIRMTASITRRRDERRLREEVEEHLALQTAENLRAGMQPNEARRQAILKFGAVTAVKEHYRDQQALPLFEQLVHDIRYALRKLLRSPGFTAIAVVTLALGIGAASAVFAVINSVLIKPLPYAEPDSLVAIWHVAPGIDGMGDVQMSAAQFVTYREQSRVFEQIGVWSTGLGIVTGTGEPEEVRRLTVSHGTLQALGIQPAFGRWFTQQEDSAGSPAIVLLTHEYWRRRFAGDRGVIGRTLTVDEVPRQVIGVMPAGFRILDTQADVILPMRFDRQSLRLGQFIFQSLARLRPGITLEAANADIARMIPIWLTSWPEAGPGLAKALENARLAPTLRPLKEDVVGHVGPVLWVVTGTIGMVLLIACANVANLLLVSLEGRRHEFGVRVALGASRLRISSELLTESVTLSLLAGVLALVVASSAIQLLVTIAPATVPRLHEIAIDSTVLIFTAVTALTAGLVLGLLSVWKHSVPHVGVALSSASRTASHGRDRHHSRHALVIGQIALSLVLLVCAGLMMRTFTALRSVNPGFSQPHEVQLMRINVPAAQFREPEQAFQVQKRVRDQIAAIPGVRAVSFASSAPMEDTYDNHDVFLSQDRTYREGQIPPVRRHELIAPGFFTTNGSSFIAGRDLTWDDIERQRPVAIVSESLAREMWHTPSSALGKRVREHPGAQWREVVGVVSDIYEDGVEKGPSSTVYWPLLKRNEYVGRVTLQRSVTYTIRSSRAGTESFLNEVRAAVWMVVPSVPVAQIRTLQDVYDGSMVRTSFTLIMLTIAAGMALILGSVGVYGALAFAVTQRTREIGVRAALGAESRVLKATFVRAGLTLAFAGVAVGLPVAVMATRLMDALLFGVTHIDPTTYGAVSLTLLTTAALASYIPARRAARLDPLVALRYE